GDRWICKAKDDFVRFQARRRLSRGNPDDFGGVQRLCRVGGRQRGDKGRSFGFAGGANLPPRPGSGGSGGRREAHSMRDSAQVTAPGAVTSMIVAVSTRPNRQNRS